MKKITLLLAAVLVSYSMAVQAQTTQVWSPIGYSTDNDFDPSYMEFHWNSQTWTPEADLEKQPADAFQPGSVMLFNDNEIAKYYLQLLDELVKSATNPFTFKWNTVSILLPAEKSVVGGIRVESDEISYAFNPAIAESATTSIISGSGNETIVKKGDSKLTINVPVSNMRYISLEGGTLARSNYDNGLNNVLTLTDSVAVAENAHVTIDLGKNNSIRANVADNSDAVFGASLHVPSSATVDFNVPQYASLTGMPSTYARSGMVHCGTVDDEHPVGNEKNPTPTDTIPSYFTGGGHINFYVNGNRFRWGSPIKWVVNMPDLSGFTGSIDFYHGDENLMPDTVDFTAPDWKNIATSKLPQMGTVIFGRGNYSGSTSRIYLSQTRGDSLFYNVWKNNPALFDSLFYDMKNVDVHVHDGVALATEEAGSDPKIVTVMFKSLNMDRGSVLAGYFSASNPYAWYCVGRDNQNGYLHGTITAALKSSSPYTYEDGGTGAGLIKVGTGTYYITADDNNLGVGVDVYEGAVYFDNEDPDHTSSTGYQKGDGAIVTARPGAAIGGNGSIGGHVALWGTLRPGGDKVGTLRINSAYSTIRYLSDSTTLPDTIWKDSKNHEAGYDSITTKLNRYSLEDRVVTRYGSFGIPVIWRGARNNRASNLLLYAGSSLEMDIITADRHDSLYVNGRVYLFQKATFEDAPVDGTVTVKLIPRDSWSVNEGDTICLLRANELMSSYVTGTDLSGEELNNRFILDDSAFGNVKFDLLVDNVYAGLDTIGYKEDVDPNTGEVIEVPVTQTRTAHFALKVVAKTTGSGEGLPEAIEEVNAPVSATIYPNPAVDGKVTVSVSEGPVGKVSVYNATGLLVKSSNSSNTSLTLDVSNLATGVYYVRIETETKTYVEKLVIK